MSKILDILSVVLKEDEMKRIFLLAFVAFVSLLFFSCRPDNSDRIHPDDYFDYASWIEENKGKNGDIVFLGDSRIAGYNWSEEFNEDGKRVLGLGVGGEVVKGVRRRLDVLESIKPECVFIAIGGNDTFYNSFTYEEFEDDYRSLLSRLIELRVPKVYIETITGLSNPEYSIQNRRISLCNTIIQGLVSEYSGCDGVEIVLLDIAFVMNDESGNVRKEYMAKDGVHFSEDGYNCWVGYLRDNCPELTSVVQ